MRNDFESNYLMHHGILGMKWGIRRYQNPDGSLTAAGRERYGVKEGGSVNDISSAKGISNRTKDLKKAIKKNEKARGKQYTKIANNPENFLGWNKKHAKKIEEHSENIRKGEAELKKLMEKKFGTETDGAIVDERAHAAARAANLDQGDNWKVYRDAQAGDKKAQEIVKQWESDKKVEGLPNDVTRDTYGFLNFTTKEKLPVVVNSDNDKDITVDKRNLEGARKAAEYVANKENLSKIKDQVVENMINDSWGDITVSKQALKDNLRVYHMYVADTTDDNVYGEINCEHRNFSGDASPYADHSIDVEFTYDTKKKKMTLSKYNSING